MVTPTPVPTPDYSQPTSYSTPTGGYSSVSTGGYSSNGGASYGPANYTSAVTGQPAYAPPSPSVLGLSTSQNGGNNGGSSGGNNGSSVPSQFNQPGGFGNPNSPDLSNQYKQNLYNQYKNWLQSQQQAAATTASAQMQAITNAYNQYQGLLENQRPAIQSAYDTGRADLNNQLQLGQQQGQANLAQLTSSYNAGMGQLGQQNQEAQAQNRELARAVGGNGSDYAQLQNKTANAFSNNQFAATNDFQTRQSQIQQGMQSLAQWGAAQQHSLATQYNQSINDLALNESLSDAQKLQNLTQIQAAYQANLGQIQSNVASMGTQLAIAQQQNQYYAMLYGKATGGYNPVSDMTSNLFGAAANASANSPQVDTSGGISYPNQNKTAGGINTNNSVSAAGF